MRAATRSPARIDPALVVILAGVSAALHVGKLPPALPVLRQELGITLLESGFLLSLVQFAGMSLGLAIGLAADGLGLRRSMLTGLALLAAASLLGGDAAQAGALLAWRALEGLGFLLVVLPAPSLIRQLVRPERMSIALGVWGTYMPLGTGVALLLGPVLIGLAGWQAWWRGLALLSLAMGFWVWRVVPPDRAHAGRANAPRAADSWWRRLRQTLGASGPWLVALSFAMYSGQWLAVIGFLPTMYVQAGVAGGATAVLTALVALVNVLGNVASGRLLARGVPPRALLYTGFAVMGAGTVAAFADGLAGPVARFLAVLLFSMVGGMIPGTLFSLAVRLAPGERTVSTTVGWMQQWSALGQFAGPPLVAWVASRAGGWHGTWWVTGACSLMGLGLAWQLGRRTS